jgi:MFS family permease
MDRLESEVKSRGIIPKLPRNAWIILGGDAISAFGNGLVLPFLIIYFNQVRDISLGVSALAISMVGLMGFIGSPLSGMLVDRIGSRRALLLSLWINVAAVVLVIFVRESWHAFVAGALLGLGQYTFWPAGQSLLSTAVPSQQRSAVFAVHFAMLNGGIGVGGVLGGLLVDVDSARSFEWLYAIDALTFVVYIAVLLTVRSVGGKVPVSAESAAAKPSYLSVLKDPVFVRVWLLMSLLSAIGWGQLHASFPAFATGPGGVGTQVVGYAFGANTLVIVLGQLFVLKKLTGWKRTTALQLMCGLCALSYGFVLLSAGLNGWAAAAGFIISLGIFGIGETILSPTIPAIVNDLAPDELRGRYNGVHSLAWSFGSVAGPAMAGLFLARGMGVALFTVNLVGHGVAALYVSRLNRHLPEYANVIGASDVGEPEAAPV